MEQLSLLPKVYEYGENLSSEEMNQIVQHLNSSIEAINYLLAKNNGINDGHCEMRYKVSAQQPEAPAAGSNGKSNGWSDTYTKPDTDNGEITWMTICFLNGNGVYGAWSNPVCITWGSIEGQRGRQGEAGVRGSFKSRVFKRQNSRPDTPTGGTYDSPFPTSGGWTDGVPQGSAIIWSSVCTFHGDGTSSGWSFPAPESDSATLDVEFSPLTNQPSAPIGNTPFVNHEAEGWYDPNSVNFGAAGTMIWRAERKISNGEYDGDWTITRIYGEKGDKGDSGNDGGRYEFRYRNYIPSEQYPIPPKPATGSNGTTGGWSETQQPLSETDIRNGSATWMTYCLKTAAGTYETWSDPIRITGANGLDGEDGSDVEFIYTRNNTGSVPSAPTASGTGNTKTFSDNDWFGLDNNGVTWTDNPTGVSENMRYEYVAVREKPAGNNTSWGAYHVALWSKWGEKGMDGDGMQYVFKLFDTELTDAQRTSNIPTKPATMTNNEWIPSGWKDDPPTVSSEHPYCYCSTIKKINGTWGNFEKLSLWAKYSKDGIGTPGKIGPMSYLAGTWAAGTPYTKTETKNPIVYYNGNYYYLIGTPPVSSTGDNPTTSNKWAQADNFDMVFTDILFVKNFSKLGSFVINNDWLITRHGIIYDSSGNPHKINGTDTWATYDQENAYTEFKPDAPQSNKSGEINFVPNVAIDAKTGKSYFQEAYIKGEINSTGGVFSGDVYANAFRAGNINGFNITVESDSINFNYGSSKQAWFSTKKLEMDSSGNIVDAGNDAPQGFYLYMISPKNGNIITINFDSLSFSEIVNNSVQVPVHTNTSLVKKITASSSGRASISNETVYYKNNKDSQGNTIPTQYYWDSECNNQITGTLDSGYYVAVKTGYVVVNETVVQGGAPYALRPVTIYQPATYISNTGKIVGSGNEVYIIDCSSNNSNLIFVTGSASASTLYNSGVYYANTGTTLNNMSGPLQIASGSSSVSVYAANKSAGSNIPTPSGTLSVFTATGSSPMTKTNYS